MNNQVTDYINHTPEAHKEIMDIVRELIHQKVKHVTEEFKWNRPIFKTTKDFAYFLSNKNDVTIGFTLHIEKLNDPDNLLKGTGKTMRHIKIKKASQIDRALLGDWFLAMTN